MCGGTGAWSNLREGDDINSVSRSQSGAHLSTGDNRGIVSLYRSPCTAERVSSATRCLLSCLEYDRPLEISAICERSSYSVTLAFAVYKFIHLLSCLPIRNCIYMKLHRIH